MNNNDLARKKLLECFPYNLEKLLDGREMTQRELAERMGVSAATIHHYVKGEKLPTAEKLVQLSQILNISIDLLLGEQILDKLNNIKQLKNIVLQQDTLNKLKEVPVFYDDKLKYISSLNYIIGNQCFNEVISKVAEYAESLYQYKSNYIDKKDLIYSKYKVKHAFDNLMKVVSHEVKQDFIADKKDKMINNNYILTNDKTILNNVRNKINENDERIFKSNEQEYEEMYYSDDMPVPTEDEYREMMDSLNKALEENKEILDQIAEAQEEERKKNFIESIKNQKRNEGNK